MELNDFIVTDHGLAVIDAGPDLLTELLEQYAALLRDSGYDLDSRLRPGRSRDEVVSLWAELGVTVPEEAVRLWAWHDGPVGGGFPGADQDSLDSAITRYQSEVKGLTDFAWHPDWIPVWGGHNIAMNVHGEIPVIRGEDGVYEWDGWDQRVQATSFCTVIAMGIYGRERGFYARNANGLPDASLANWPERMRITRLYGW